MTSTQVLAPLATTMGVAMGASPLIQAMRVHQRRQSSDVSLPFLLVIFLGGAAWLSYGIALGNVALVISNSVGTSSAAATLAVVVRWRRAENSEA